MSLRLNKSDKEYVASKARQLSPMNLVLAQVHEDRKAIAETVRVELLGGITKANRYDELLKQAFAIREELPDEVRAYSVGINHGNSFNVYLDVNRERVYLQLENDCVVPESWTTLKPSHKCYQALVNSVDQTNAIEKQLQELQSTVYASIASITTVKKLLESWEEAKDLLPQHLLQPKAQLPALQTKQLNKLIGLPVVKKAP